MKHGESTKRQCLHKWFGADYLKLLMVSYPFLRVLFGGDGTATCGASGLVQTHH